MTVSPLQATEVCKGGCVPRRSGAAHQAPQAGETEDPVGHAERPQNIGRENCFLSIISAC